MDWKIFWKNDLNSCLDEVEDKNMVDSTRAKRREEICVLFFEIKLQSIPNEKKYCEYFKCDKGKESFKDMLNSCIEKGLDPEPTYDVLGNFYDGD